MIVEYVRYGLSEHEPDALIAAYRTAAEHLRAAPACLGYDLSQCADDPASFVLAIRWTSAEDHLGGFRTGPNFPPFLGAIRPFVGEIVEMRHYRPTGVAWRRDDEEQET